ncbi:glycosyltransferase domain-containing protein [Providencia rettgeri]
MKKILIYTAITGGYDSLNPVLAEEPNVDYICITDYNFTGNIPSPWRHIRLPPSKLSNKNLARFCKINPHILFPYYNTSIWIDGNVSIKQPLSLLAFEVLKNHKIASYEHWGRDQTEQEFYECARCGFDFAWKLKRQSTRYILDGYTSPNFFENNVIFRNHMDKKIIDMQNIWWKEYILGGKRDQYSFTYSAYKASVNIFSLGISDPRISKVYFDYHLHKRNRPLWQTVLIVINRLYLLFSKWSVSKSKRKNLLSQKK